MGGILSAPKPAPPPPLPPPTPLPDIGDAKTQAAKKKTLAAAASRTGRASTILTDYGTAGGDKFGG